jgi:N-acetylmuramoyl-L-alanine amidase
VLDPGHGGENHGCRSPGGDVEEKEVTLELAVELRARLAERLPHARVVLTRDDDRSMTLADRVALANEVDADVFVSLHVNASESRTQHGFESYVLDARASTLQAAATAMRENDGTSAGRPAEVMATSMATSMVRQLQLAGNRERAARLAQAIQRGQSTRFPARLDRGVKQAPFDVLMGATMPAVLFEAAFLDNVDEGTLLIDPDARARMVDGLAEALVTYYRESTLE